MADLTVTEADLQSLSAALVVTLTDLQALQNSLRHMDVGPVGAPPLLEEERTLTRTRDSDLTALGEGVAARHEDIDRVMPTLHATDERLASNVQRAE
jgi:hypothetical protein